MTDQAGGDIIRIGLESNEVIAGLQKMHSGVLTLSNALEVLTSKSAREFGLRFQGAIGLVNDGIIDTLRLLQQVETKMVQIGGLKVAGVNHPIQGTSIDKPFGFVPAGGFQYPGRPDVPNYYPNRPPNEYSLGQQPYMGSGEMPGGQRIGFAAILSQQQPGNLLGGAGLLDFSTMGDDAKKAAFAEGGGPQAAEANDLKNKYANYNKLAEALRAHLKAAAETDKILEKLDAKAKRQVEFLQSLDTLREQAAESLPEVLHEQALVNGRSDPSYGDFSRFRAAPRTMYDDWRDSFALRNVREAAKLDAEANMPRYREQERLSQIYLSRAGNTTFEQIRQASMPTMYDEWRAAIARQNEQAASAYLPYIGGPTGVQNALNVNMGLAQSKLAEATAAFRTDRSPANEAAYKSAAAAVEDLKNKQKDLNEAARQLGQTTEQTGDKHKNFAEKLAATAEYAVRAFVIYQGAAMALRQVQQSLSQGMELERTQIEVGFISGKSATATTADFVEAARYGIGPSQAAAGLYTAAQTGADKAQMEAARQMTLLFGQDSFVNNLQEIQQSERRAAAVGQKFDLEQYKNFIATGVKMVSRPNEEYSDAYQLALEMQSTLGVDAARGGMGILNVVKATEQSPQIIANMIERFRIALEGDGSQDNRDALAKLGISASDTPGYFRAISSAATQATQAGDTERVDQIMRALVGGLAGPQTLVQARQIFTELDATLNGVNPKLADFNTLINGLNSSAQKATAEFKATWELFFANLGLVFFNSDIGKAITKGLGDASTGMQLVTETNPIQEKFAAMSDSERLKWLQDYLKENPDSPLKEITSKYTGLSGAGFDDITRNDFMGEVTRGVFFDDVTQESTMLFLKWLGEMLDKAAASSELGDEANRAWVQSFGQVGSTATAPGKNMPGLPSYEFGGFNTLTKGMDWDKLTADIKKYEDKLQKEVPGYELDRREVAFWDETRGYYRTVVGDNEAIRRAVEEQRDLMKQITGLFNVPAGGEVLIPFAALEAGFGPDYDGTSGGSTGNGAGRSFGRRGQKGSSSVKGSRGSSSKSAGGGKARSNAHSNVTDLGVHDSYPPPQGERDDPMDQALDFWLNDRKGLSRGQQADADRYQRQADAIAQMQVQVNITLHNRVTISGRTVIDATTQEMQNQLAQTRRGGGGAGAQALAN